MLIWKSHALLALSGMAVITAPVFALTSIKSSETKQDSSRTSAPSQVPSASGATPGSVPGSPGGSSNTGATTRTSDCTVPTTGFMKKIYETFKDTEESKKLERLKKIADSWGVDCQGKSKTNS